MAATMTGGLKPEAEATTADRRRRSTAAQAETTKEETKAEETAEAPAEVKRRTPITINIAYMPNYGSFWSVMKACHEKGYLEEEAGFGKPW
ncbi:MAG: hypothetical protein V8S98_05135 [Lachnospiraceae bacterium]